MRAGYVEGKVAIVDVLADSSAARAGIEPGMIGATVDGRPGEERIAEAKQNSTLSEWERLTRMLILRSVFAGTLEAPLLLGLERTDGSEVDGGGGKGGGQGYGGPVVILMSESSGSAAELFAAGLQDAGRAKVAGAESCGGVLGITKHRVMKGGGVLEISEILWFSPK